MGCARAVALQNPFFTAAAWSPGGVNLLANTTSVGLAIVVAPVTWLLGPVAALFPLLAFGQLTVQMAGMRVVSQSITADAAVDVEAARVTDARLVTYPFAQSARGLVQQATSSFDYELVGGWGPQARSGTDREVVVRQLLSLSPISASRLSPRDSSLWWDSNSLTGASPVSSRPASLRWRTSIGATWSRGAFAATMTEMYGAPRGVRGEWVWRVRGRVAGTQTLRTTQWYGCVAVVYTLHPRQLPRCVTRALASNAPT